VPGGKIVLKPNGILANGDGIVSFISRGYASNIVINSGVDISAFTFEIIGTYNGIPVQENLIGPNAATVVSVNLYHTITSIIVRGAAVGAFTIGANESVAITLTNYNTNNVNNPNLKKYSVMLMSLAAGGPWGAGEVLVYGVSHKMPSTLTTNKLLYAQRDSTLYAINDEAAPVQQVDLNNGIIYSSNYPFIGIIVYLRNGVIDAPCFVEITQS
jgi:hypothetical protein